MPYALNLMAWFPMLMEWKAARFTLSISVTVWAALAKEGSEGEAAGVMVMSALSQNAFHVLVWLLRLVGLATAAARSSLNVSTSAYIYNINQGGNEFIRRAATNSQTIQGTNNAMGVCSLRLPRTPSATQQKVERTQKRLLFYFYSNSTRK